MVLEFQLTHTYVGIVVSVLQTEAQVVHLNILQSLILTRLLGHYHIHFIYGNEFGLQRMRQRQKWMKIKRKQKLLIIYKVIRRKPSKFEKILLQACINKS
mmetsp:Transcript_15828/g.25330  ORF Transcript_15828/g.25330 Transcript_15828/m.25330 type:complete len:100 (+) Transcript_15828:2163-2462(+)